MKKILLMSFMLLFTMVSSSWAQDRSVSGKVTDDTGEGVPGVNVILKGTTTGTTSDIDGNYKLNVPSEGGTLVYSFIGMTTQENEIGARSVIDVGMLADARELSEVVITAVGIEQNKRSLGYSVQNVAADDIRNAGESNLINALNSKVAGVSVVSGSGSPGASASIRIRGNTSINGSNSPLFVIDGIPIDNSSANVEDTSGNGALSGYDFSNRVVDLNSSDIGSLVVLKGAAATALYGIRAANGAIIITTKRGVKGKPKVSFSSSYTVDKVNKLPSFQTSYAQGRPVGGASTWRGPDTGEGFSWGPAIADLEYDGSDYDFHKDGRLVATGTGNGKAAQGYDNVSNLFVDGVTTDNNVSVSGGSDKTTYYFSAGLLNQSGTVPNSDWARHTFKATAESKVTDKLTVGMSATYSNSGGRRLQRGSNISGLGLGLFRTSPSFDNGNGKVGQAAADDNSSYELADGTQRGYRAGIYDSPYWTINKNQFKDDVTRFIGYTSLAYEINSWLKLSYKVGLDTYTDRTKGFADINSASFQTGQITNAEIISRDLNSDFLLIFNKEINSDLSISGVLGHNYYTYDYYRNRALGTGLGSPGFNNISNAATIQATEAIFRKKINGVFGDIKFEYKNFLFVNFTGRNDWSSSLPEDNNSFFYPAISMGFDFTEAFGIANGDILSYGKLRGSWGKVGNDANIYVTKSYFNANATGGDGFIAGITFPAYGVSAFERSLTLGNDQLKAELTTTYEVGGEFKFFKGRISVDYTYYNSSTEDQIINTDISFASGFGGSIVNAGLIENSGHELFVYANPVKVGDFKWEVEANFTKNVSLVKEINPGVTSITLAGFTSASSRVVVGHPYGAIWGSRFDRDTQGNLIIGSNGWPLRAATDTVLGNPNPDWTLGLRNTLSYKGFSVSALLDIRTGGDIWNGTDGIINYFGTSKETAENRNIQGYVFKGVTADGSANTVPVDFANPANGLGGNKWIRYGFGGLVEENIQDGSWIRLRELTMSYSIPSSILDNIGISRATFSLTGRNLWLKTNYTGIDPETNLNADGNGFGLDYFNMPNTKSYGATLKVQF